MYKHSALETIFTALDTQLNSLANGSACSPSSVIDNGTTGTQRWPAAMVEIYIAAQASARSTGASVSLYIVPTTDGTNYGDVTAECLNNYLVGTYSLDAATTARRITKRVNLPPTDYKVVLKNNTGQPLASTLNTVKFREFTAEDA